MARQDVMSKSAKKTARYEGYVSRAINCSNRLIVIDWFLQLGEYERSVNGRAK
jgi:hypothetical protein